MKLFSTSKTINMHIVELPRQSWRVLPPRKLAVLATVALIVVTAVVWSLS